MRNYVKISVGSEGSVSGRIEAEFDAPDEVVELLKQIIVQVPTFNG